ncbi:hypothetical protein EV715DRAFT_295854 [Schizophyllum commune]
MSSAPSSSLSSVVSNLVRASMGSSVSPTVTDEDLDRHVAELILKEAKKKAERYQETGIRAYLAPSLHDANAPRPNKRFLSSIIKSTDDHNRSILRAQAEAAEEIQRQRREEERRERMKRAEEAVASRRSRGAGSSRGEGSSSRREERHSSRREEGRQSRRHRERSEERDEDEHWHRVAEDEKWDHWDGRTAERDPKRKRCAWEDADVDDDEVKHSHKRRHRSRSQDHEKGKSKDDRTHHSHRHRSRSKDSERRSSHKHTRRHHRHRSPSPTSSSTRDDAPPSKHKRTRSPSPASRGEGSSRRSPSDTIPSRESSPTPGPTPPLPSKMDKYFEEDYDPRLDVDPLPAAPHIPATGLIDNTQFEGWDAMLDLLRKRKEDKEEKKRLERLGFDPDAYKAPSGGFGDGWGGSSGGTNVMDIQYSKRGTVREWDKGKDMSF